MEINARKSGKSFFYSIDGGIESKIRNDVVLAACRMGLSFDDAEKAITEAEENANATKKLPLSASTGFLGETQEVYIPRALNVRGFGAADQELVSEFKWYNNGDEGVILFHINPNTHIHTLVNTTSQEAFCASIADDDYIKDSLNEKWSKCVEKVLGIFNQNYIGKTSAEINRQGVQDLILANFPLTVLRSGVAAISLHLSKGGEKNPEDYIYTDVAIREASTGGVALKNFCPNFEQVYSKALLPNISKLGDKYRLKRMPIAYASKPNIPCIHYLPLEERLRDRPKKNISTWEEYLTKYTPEEASVFKSWVYSVFDCSNNSRQALYMYDPQGFVGSKSTICNVISWALGEENVGALQKDSLSNQFSLAKVFDKRLVIFGDNKNKNIIRSEKMHLLLGGDIVDVERKGKESFAYRMRSKVLIASNIMPEIDPHAAHERTRLIIIHPKATPEILRKICVIDENGNPKKDLHGQYVFKGDPWFEDRLKAEFWDFLFVCQDEYSKTCPNHNMIILPPSVANKLWETSPIEHDYFSEFVSENLTVGNGFVTRLKLMENYQKYQSENRFDFGRGDSDSFTNMVDYLKKAHNVIEQKGEKGNVYSNVMLKGAFIPQPLEESFLPWN